MESTNPKDKIGKTKPPLHLIPPAATIHESMAMKNGADKYGPYNWRGQTVAATVYVAAAKRHLESYLDGENVDAESGAHHLGHARACAGILLDATEQGTLVDDRPVKGTAADLIRRLTRGKPAGEYEYAANPVAEAVAHAKDGDTVEVETEALNQWLIQRDAYTSFDHAAEQEWREVVEDARLSVARLRNRLSNEVFHLGCLSKVSDQIAGGTTFPIAGPNAMRGVYVAGPMRNLPEFNFPAFDEATVGLLRKGYFVISPADIDRGAGVKEKDHTDGNAEAFDQRVFVYRDFHALYYLAHTEGGAIAMLPGWEKSTGAVAEFFLARWLGLKVLDAQTGDYLLMMNVDTNAIARSIRNYLVDQQEA